MPPRRRLLPALLALAVAAPGRADWHSEDLGRLSLEELMQVEVITVARKEQTLLQAPAAVSVLTGDDLRRSGAATVPDALRLLPGVQVARIDANKWSVTARGFGGQFANKLLVLVDGRTVYTPLFGGVFWDVQDLLLEDVERIEVVRGPGATQWGANAVNGVVNIITRHSARAQGTLVHVGGGPRQRAEAAVAHGGRLDGATTWRAVAKVFDVPTGTDTAGVGAEDGQRLWRGGLRFDRDTADGALLLQAGLYGGQSGQTYTQTPVSLTPPYLRTFPASADLAGAHLLGRWRRGDGDAAFETVVQGYLDATARDNPADLREARQTADLDLLQRRAWRRRHELVWGLGARLTRDDIDPPSPSSWTTAAEPTCC